MVVFIEVSSYKQQYVRYHEACCRFAGGRRDRPHNMTTIEAI